MSARDEVRLACGNLREKPCEAATVSCPPKAVVDDFFRMNHDQQPTASHHSFADVESWVLRYHRYHRRMGLRVGATAAPMAMAISIAMAPAMGGRLLALALS